MAAGERHTGRVVLGVIIYIIGLWLGTVLGLDAGGTWWD